MVRLAISVEGDTEERFVRETLAPYLVNKEIYATPVLLGGKGGSVSLSRIKEDLNELVYGFDKVTTLYDFYGFRGKDKGETKASLEQKILNEVNESMRGNVVPYVQMYEFEGLLFSCPEVMEGKIGQKGMGRWAQGVLREFGGNPERINDSEQTAPSRRLLVKGYNKVTHGPAIAHEIGLEAMTGKCAGFAAWLRQLEGLGS